MGAWVQDELARHEEARELIRQGSGRETSERLYVTIFLVVISIHQVLAFEERVRRTIVGQALFLGQPVLLVYAGLFFVVVASGGLSPAAIEE